jgi:hypothetical protein
MDGFPNYALLAGVGLIAGALNAVAGGGSILTLPFLIVFGLPASVGKWHQSSGGASSKPYRLLGISALEQALEWNGLPAGGASAIPIIVGSLGTILLGRLALPRTPRRLNLKWPHSRGVRTALGMALRNRWRREDKATPAHVLACRPDYRSAGALVLACRSCTAFESRQEARTISHAHTAWTLTTLVPCSMD